MSEWMMRTFSKFGSYFRLCSDKLSIVLSNISNLLLAWCALQSVFLGRQAINIVCNRGVIDVTLSDSHGVVSRNFTNFSLLASSAKNFSGRNAVSCDFRKRVLLSLGFGKSCVVILDSFESSKLLVGWHTGIFKIVEFGRLYSQINYFHRNFIAGWQSLFEFSHAIHASELGRWVRITCCTGPVAVGLVIFINVIGWMLRYLVRRACDFITRFVAILTFVSGWVLLSGVHLGIPILRLPVWTNKATGFSKVGCEVDVLFPALYLCFEATTSLTPLFNELFGLFVAAFVCKLLVLCVEPHLF